MRASAFCIITTRRSASLSFEPSRLPYIQDNPVSAEPVEYFDGSHALYDGVPSEPPDLLSETELVQSQEEAEDEDISFYKPGEVVQDSAPWAARLSSFEKLLHESDVTASPGSTPRLVDSEDHKHDFALWSELLRFRRRLLGVQGAREIFSGIRDRNIDLPTEGEEAKELWSLLARATYVLNGGQELWDYSLDLYARTGRRYEGLYTLLVGHWIFWRRSRAIEAHQHCQSLGLPAAGGMRELMTSITISARVSSTLRRLYLESNERDLYDTVMPKLYSDKRWGEALYWHLTFLEAGDYPSSLLTVQPLLQHRKTQGQTEYMRFVQTLRDANLMKGSNPAVQTSGMSGPKTIGDDFCARAFATKAFTPGFVIRTMKTFGVRSIGPLSLQELAVRCRELISEFRPDMQDPLDTLASEVTIQLDSLKAAKIQLQDCRFSTLIDQLARGGYGALLDATLSSDQHPDVYEDKQLQMNLLDCYLIAEDWTQVHRTLFVLALTHEDAAKEAWNRLFVAYANQPGPDRNSKLNNVLQEMNKLKIPLAAESFMESYHRLLPRWNPTKIPIYDPHHVNQLIFLTNLWLSAINAGSVVPTSCWDYIIRRYGAFSMYDELERLCIWLAQFNSDEKRTRGSFANRSKYKLNKLFGPLMQRAIVEWYFKSLQFPDHVFPPRKPKKEVETIIPDLSTPALLSQTQTWARGLTLVRLLETYGVRVDLYGVYLSCRHRLRLLYGAGLSKRRMNRVAMEKNPHTLQGMLRYLQIVWKPFRLQFSSLLPFSDLDIKDPGFAAREYKIRRQIAGYTRPEDRQKRIQWMVKKRGMRMRYLDRYRGEAEREVGEYATWRMVMAPEDDHAARRAMFGRVDDERGDGTPTGQARQMAMESYYGNSSGAGDVIAGRQTSTWKSARERNYSPSTSVDTGTEDTIEQEAATWDSGKLRFTRVDDLNGWTATSLKTARHRYNELLSTSCYGSVGDDNGGRERG